MEFFDHDSFGMTSDITASESMNTVSASNNIPSLDAPFSRSPIQVPRSRSNSTSESPTPFGAKKVLKDCPKEENRRKARQPWSEMEDKKLEAVMKHSTAKRVNWSRVSMEHGYGRNGKQCRERWGAKLRPNIVKGNWTAEEVDLIRRLYTSFGPKWSAMSKTLPHRSDSDIKNKWYSMDRSGRNAYMKRYNKILKIGANQSEPEMPELKSEKPKLASKKRKIPSSKRIQPSPISLRHAGREKCDYATGRSGEDIRDQPYGEEEHAC